jgi:beta-glucosidase
VLNILTGLACPRGKLSESYPLRYEDVASAHYFPGREYTTEYRESLYVGYRYFATVDNPVLFPFGYGLSYTTFAYANLSADSARVVFTLKNSGQTAGAEIAQRYISKQSDTIFRPRRELKGFAKIFLAPGESKEVTIQLDDKAFRYYNVATRRFEVEAGLYTIQIGASAMDIRLGTSVLVPGTKTAPYDPAQLPSYFSGQVENVSDQEFERLLGRPIPNGKWDTSQPYGRNDTIAQLYYARSLIARLAYLILSHLKHRAEKKGESLLKILFIFNVPYRGVAKLMGGSVDLATIDACLEILNGHFLAGSAHLITAQWRMRKANRAFAQKLKEAGRLAKHEKA